MESVPRMERRINKGKLRCKHIIVNFKNINNIEEIQKLWIDEIFTKQNDLY